MIFQRNCWYVAALPTEVGQAFMARRIIGVEVLLYRREDGTPVAISNICPHRFAPLDRGVRIGDDVQCRYHGLTFGPDGQCVRNPYVERPTAAMRVASFPVVERHGLVWIWMGQGAGDPLAIPDMSAHEDNAAQHVVRNYLHTDYRYDILIDNLMDLSHADYLHDGSFSQGPAQTTELSVEERGDGVIVNRLQRDGPAPPMFPWVQGAADIFTEIHWRPGQVIAFRMRVAPSGAPMDGASEAVFAHIATPADENHTHYFMSVTLPGASNPELDERVRSGQLNVIRSEDGPMLDAIHETMRGRPLMEMRPLTLPGDLGGLIVRRTMKRLLDAEGAAPA